MIFNPFKKPLKLTKGTIVEFKTLTVNRIGKIDFISHNSVSIKTIGPTYLGYNTVSIKDVIRILTKEENPEYFL